MGNHVLLVEDEPNIVEAIRFILLRDGWRVSCLADGATAMNEIARIDPDVIVLDVMLPNRSGFDILRDIRAAASTATIPVLMLTAKGQARDRDRAEALGVSRFMTKPFSNAEVLDILRQLVVK